VEEVGSAEASSYYWSWTVISDKSFLIVILATFSSSVVFLKNRKI